MEPILIRDRYCDPESQIKNRFQSILDSAKKHDISQFDVVSIEDCHRNIKALDQKKLHAGKLYRETNPRRQFITSVFQGCFVDTKGGFWHTRQIYKDACSEIDRLVKSNFQEIENRCQEVISDPKGVTNSVDIMAAFLWGISTRGGKIHFKKELRCLYRKIEEMARQGHYSLGELRRVVRALESINADFQNETLVCAGKEEFVFHDLLLFHQFGGLRHKHEKLPFKVTLDVHPLIVENLFQFVEEGRVPHFKGFKEQGAIKFLKACDQLKLSAEIVNEGLFLLEDKSKHFSLKVYEKYTAVTYQGKFDEKSLEHLVAVDQARSIAVLDLSQSNFAPIPEYLHILSTQFQHLQEFRCSPYSTSSTEEWNKFFDLPKLRKIVFHMTDYDEDYLENLALAIEDHKKPPKIQIVNACDVSLGLMFRLCSKN